MGTEKQISDLTSKSCYTPAITQVSLAQLDEMVNKVFDKLKNIDKCERVKRINHESYFVNYEFTYVASKEYSIKYNAFARMYEDPTGFVITYGIGGFCALQIIISKYYKYSNPTYEKESDLPEDISAFSIIVKSMFMKLINEFENNTSVKSKPTTTKEEKEMKKVTVTGMVETDVHEITPDFVINELDLLHLVDHVIINPPAIIVFWKDGTKTVVTCKEDDQFDEEKGLAMAITKKVLGNKYSYSDKFNTILRKAKRINDDSKAMITFTNNEDDENCEADCTECGGESCSCDEASNMSGPTNEDIMQAINQLLLRFVEIRQDVDDLKKSKSKKKKKKDE